MAYDGAAFDLNGAEVGHGIAGIAATPPPGIADPWPRRDSTWTEPADSADRRARTTVVEQRAFGKLTVLDVALDAARDVTGIRSLVYQPGGFATDMPVVFVMHGIYRDPWNYLESWVGLAEHHGFVLVVPQFSRADWPTNRQYNLGNVRARGGAAVPVGAWSFTAIETVFDAVRDHFCLETGTFNMYGHSAGAQFVHRFVLHTGGRRVARAVAANAGWYMAPDAGVPYPYGIADAAIDRVTLRSAFATQMILLLGEKDNDPNSRNLRTKRRAQRQGRHRFARGEYFLRSAEAAADALKLSLRWRIRTVPDVGHNDRAMAPHGCAALFGTTHHQE